MDTQSDQTSTQGADTQTQDTGTQQSAPAAVDLDSQSSFTYQGKTYTPDQWHEVYQGYQKYGETSKYVSEDQKFWSNVFVDIEAVAQNPNLMGRFKELYPERFHAVLERELKRQQGQGSSGGQTQTQNAQTNQIPRELMDRLSKVDALEQRLYQADVQAASAQIDAILPKLSSKYPLSDEDRILAGAERVLASGRKMSEATWERLAREDHERAQKRSDAFYKSKLSEQIKAGEQGRDTGPGGGAPGTAPVKPRNFAQAEAEMIKSLRNKKG